MPAIEAEQSLRQTSIVATPHLKPRDRQAFLRRLQRKARGRTNTAPERKYPDAVQDPASAADWFESRGMRVVKAG